MPADSFFSFAQPIGGKLWSPAVLWDPKQILALLLATAVKWTVRILAVHIGPCSHVEQEP